MVNLAHKLVPFKMDFGLGWRIWEWAALYSGHIRKALFQVAPGVLGGYNKVARLVPEAPIRTVMSRVLPQRARNLSEGLVAKNAMGA